MKKSTEAKIKALGFADMGDHFSLHMKNKAVTITEHRMGESIMLELLVTVKTRQLSHLEKENLARIAVINRESRLENINIGEQTSILLSVVIPEEEAGSLQSYIEKANKYLDKVVKRVADSESTGQVKEEELMFDFCG